MDPTQMMGAGASPMGAGGPGAMNPMLMLALMMQQAQQGQNPAQQQVAGGGETPNAGGAGAGDQGAPGTSLNTGFADNLGAMLRGNPQNMAGSASDASSASGIGPMQTGNFANPVPPEKTGIGSAPAGFDTGTQSPGTTQGAPPAVPATQAVAGTNMGNAFGNLAGIKAPAAPMPITHAGVTGGVHPMQGVVAQHGQQSQALAALLSAILGGRGTGPLGIPALGANLRG